MIGTRQEGTTTIGRGASLRGDLKTTGDIIIEGALDGSLHADESRVSVGREARVRADIIAREVIIEGHVVGNVRATERVELRSSATVEGNVFAKRFAMEENAALRGHVDPSGSSVTARPEPTPAPATRPEPVAAPAPVTAQAPAAETPLFNTQRPAGSMPAALAAAAARNLGTPSNAGPSSWTADDHKEGE